MFEQLSRQFVCYLMLFLPTSKGALVEQSTLFSRLVAKDRMRITVLEIYQNGRERTLVEVFGAVRLRLGPRPCSQVKTESSVHTEKRKRRRRRGGEGGGGGAPVVTKRRRTTRTGAQQDGEKERGERRARREGAGRGSYTYSDWVLK